MNENERLEKITQVNKDVERLAKTNKGIMLVKQYARDGCYGYDPETVARLIKQKTEEIRVRLMKRRHLYLPWTNEKIKEVQDILSGKKRVDK